MTLLRRVLPIVLLIATAPAAAERQLFWTTEPIELTLQAPLGRLFAEGRTDEQAKVAATLGREFLGRRAALYYELDHARLDPEGRRIIRQYLDAFYGAIGQDSAFYRPVLVKDGTKLYLDAGKAKEACESGDTIPVGTVIGEPAQRSGSMIQVVLLDVLWRWGPPKRCDALHAGPVWIDADAVGRDYPAR